MCDALKHTATAIKPVFDPICIETKNNYLIMSIIHNIQYKRPLDIPKLYQFVSTIDCACYEERGDDVYYFWVDGKSARGMNISLEEDLIEVRNPFLSNKHDYELTNQIVEEILSMTDGMIQNEADEKISGSPLFEKISISKIEMHDFQIFKTLMKKGEDITMVGPNRLVYFGKRLFKQFNELTEEQGKDKIFDTILHVNYKIPAFDYVGIMQFGNTDEDKKTMSLLTNTTDCIIGKYDYILIYLGGDVRPAIMITNEILNTMLPSNWTLVDEYTVVAPITNPYEWNKLIATAAKHDMTEKVFGN